MRQLFLEENNFQFIHNKCHEYGWADSYIFTCKEQKAGYAAVWGRERRSDRDTLFEFYLLPAYRQYAASFFTALHQMTGITWMECQSNDSFALSLLFMHTKEIGAEAILFKENYTSNIVIPGLLFRERNEEDECSNDDGEYVLEYEGTIAGTGGLMLNYNRPYADIYMAIREPYRRRGFGAYLVQELKKEAYRISRVPAARCNINNAISRATLEKAGFIVCGFLLYGTIKVADVPGVRES